MTKRVLSIVLAVLFASNLGCQSLVAVSAEQTLGQSRLLAPTTDELFVSTAGSDSNLGRTPTSAFGSIARALFAARTSLNSFVSVKVTSGSFLETERLVLSSNVSLVGGFGRNFSSKHSAAQTDIALAPGTSLKCEEQTFVRMEGLHFLAEPSRTNNSAVAAHFKLCRQVVIHNVSFTALAALEGSEGTPGATGDAGGKLCTVGDSAHDE